MEQSQTNNNQQNNNVGYTFDPSKINKDFLLDAVTFSDDEDTNQPINLDANTYNKEMQKIETLYNPIPIDEDDGGTMNTYTGTKNEILEKDIKEFPKPFELSPNDKMTLCGHVNDIVEGKILIDNCIPINHVLNLDNIIFNSNNIAVGFIDDVIGNIESPIYVARIYPDLLEKGLSINKGEALFYCDSKVSFVAPKELINKHKGCDASNAFDEEVSEDSMEFSDDEEESKARAMKRNKRKQNKKPKIDETNKNLIINPEYKINNEPNKEMQNQIEMFGNMINNAMSMNMNPFAQPIPTSMPNIFDISMNNNQEQH